MPYLVDTVFTSLHQGKCSGLIKPVQRGQEAAHATGRVSRPGAGRPLIRAREPGKCYSSRLMLQRFLELAQQSRIDTMAEFSGFLILAVPV